MGCCCSCLEGKDGSDAAETEMQAQIAEEENKTLCIARGMSAPSIEVSGRTKVSGHGLALAAVVVEQDAGYWEIHVILPEGQNLEVPFGVATKKDRKFYKPSEEGGEDSSPEQSNGTDLMSKIKVSRGDTVGVAVQQSDLPMIQFTLNGEELHEKSINRFRGAVYPAVFLPSENEGLSMQFVFRETDFRESPPNSRFVPIMVARGLV